MLFPPIDPNERFRERRATARRRKRLRRSGAVAVVLADTYSWWESALVGVFCAVPVFLLGAVWAGSAHARRQSAS